MICSAKDLQHQLLYQGEADLFSRFGMLIEVCQEGCL